MCKTVNFFCHQGLIKGIAHFQKLEVTSDRVETTSAINTNTFILHLTCVSIDKKVKIFLSPFAPSFINEA